MRSKKQLLYLVCFISLFSLLFSLWALEEKHGEFLVENFEETADNIDSLYWWFADNIKPSLKVSTQMTLDGTQRRWLRVSGSTTKWYVGVFGKWINTDATKYDAVKMTILNAGLNSDRLTIRLDQDDTGHCSLDVDKNYVPVHNDRFEYDLTIDWQGWRTVTIPFNEFHLINPGAGKGLWDPAQKNGSCGLMDIQFVLCTTDKIGNADIGIGKVELVK